MKKISKYINKKIYGNVGLFLVVGIVCVFGIMTSTFNNENKQVGDVRGDSTHLTPTEVPTEIPTCSVLCQGYCCGGSTPDCGEHGCEAHVVYLTPTVVPTIPACNPPCLDNQTCSYGHCIDNWTRCSNNSINCGGCSSGSYRCCTGPGETNCTWYSNASCNPPSCPAPFCASGNCHSETFQLCCAACSNCSNCTRLVDNPPPTPTIPACPAAQNCPTGCHTNSVLVDDGNCGKTTCSANCSTTCSNGTCCPAAGSCLNNCGNNGTVPNGSCGTIACGCKECGPHGSQTCGNWTQTYDCASSINGCKECGPHRSGSGCGSWTETYDCSSSSTSGCTECGPHGSNTGCGSWTQTYDCRSSVTGCNECVTCTLQCGQLKSCGGSCGSANAGTPAQVVITSPNGTSAAPTIFTGGLTVIPLTWVKDASILNPYYHIELYNSSNALIWTGYATRTSNTINTNTLVLGQTYHWRVRAANDACALAGFGTTTYYGAWSNYGYFKLNQTPAFGDFVIYNSLGNTTVAPQAGNRNHICQANLMENNLHVRKVMFQVSITDPDGGTDIKKVSLRFRDVTTNTDYVVATFDSVVGSSLTGNGVNYWGSGVTTTVSGTARSVNFPIQFAEDFNTAIYNMEVYAQDVSQSELPVVWTDTNRDFKVWSCKVPVRGALYDGSKEPFGPFCSTDSSRGFSDLGEVGSFSSLTFTGIPPATNKTMTVNSPYYLSSGNDLIFNMQYNPVFSGLAGTNPIVKITDIGSGATTSTCSNPIYLSGAVVSPYSNSPELQIDFSSILDQESWFQTIGGGVNSKSVITDNVPITCSLDSTGVCKAAISSDTAAGTFDSGLIAAGTEIKNTSGCENDCKFGNANNWGINKDVIGENYNYNYFYDRYYTGLKQGNVYKGEVNLSNISQTGVDFVDGNLNVDVRNPAVSPGNFLMVIVSGNINISSTVNSINGIFVADGSINAVGKSDAPLIINGMLYSTGLNSKVSLTRSYQTKEFNNTSPAVVIKYRPDFIFSMPGKLVKVLSGWKEGQ